MTRHAGGRPLLFKTPQELWNKAEEWFAMTPVNQQTITGVAIYLDTSRETLINYEKRDEFFDTVKKIKDKIEYSYELSLRTRGSAGDIFGLKNFGWRDKHEVESSGEITHKYEELNDDELERAIKEQQDRLS